jgi:hypothetical protein
MLTASHPRENALPPRLLPFFEPLTTETLQAGANISTGKLLRVFCTALSLHQRLFALGRELRTFHRPPGERSESKERV